MDKETTLKIMVIFFAVIFAIVVTQGGLMVLDWAFFDKAEFCTWNGYDVIVDTSCYFPRDCAKLGIDFDEFDRCMKAVDINASHGQSCWNGNVPIKCSELRKWD